MLCPKHNVATYGRPTCKVCELEALAARLAKLLQRYQQGEKTDSTYYTTSIALAKAREYGLIRNK